MVQLDPDGPIDNRYIMCVWLPVSMFKLRSLMNIDDKSGVGRKICRYACFFPMLRPFFPIYDSEKDNRPQIGENQTFLDRKKGKKEFKF